MAKWDDKLAALEGELAKEKRRGLALRLALLKSRSEVVKLRRAMGSEPVTASRVEDGETIDD